MKTFVFILSFCLLAGLAAAQEVAPWMYVRHSALTLEGNVHIRFDGVPELGDIYSLYSRNDNSWISHQVNLINELEYEAVLPYLAGQQLPFRLRASTGMGEDMYVAMNPAWLPNNNFPPPLNSMAMVADDPVGDSLMIYAPVLDLTGSWFGCTDSRFFGALQNLTGNYPTLNSFSSYNLFFIGLVNMESIITQNTIFAMIYTFSIPGVISPGLYEVGLNGTMPTFQRLGNIQNQVVSGKLMMSCALSDLTASPSFGQWPNATNSLGLVSGTMRINIDMISMQPTYYIGDTSVLANLYFENHVYQATVNILPEISEVFQIHDEFETYLTFTYFDANEDFPLYAKVILDNEEEIELRAMLPDYSEPVVMGAYLPLYGWQEGVIKVSDNNYQFVEYPITNTVSNEDPFQTPVVSCRISPNPYQPSKGKLTVNVQTKNNSPLLGGVYNLKGELVQRVCLTPQNNSAEFRWDGLSANGKPAAAGIYFLKLNQQLQSYTQKFILIR